eukprot:591894-Alexandrium_andersonii.AAC.1
MPLSLSEVRGEIDGKQRAPAREIGFGFVFVFVSCGRGEAACVRARRSCLGCLLYTSDAADDM